MSHSRRPARSARARRGVSLLRLRAGFLVVAMVLSVFAVRLFQIQGIDAHAYVALAEAEGMVTVELPATRGAITDRNGVALAESIDGLMLVADPSLTTRDASAIATIVARRLDVDYFEVLERLRQPDTRFQYLARRVPSTLAREVVDAIERAGYSGVDTRRDPVRDYPAGDVAANILGFINDDGAAGEGAELLFDDRLSGTDGSTTYETGGGNRIPLGENEVIAPRSGEDLQLTIDRDVQWYTQRVLRTTVQDAGAASGTAVVMDTRTGELLALADYPTYDPNDPSASKRKDIGIRALRDIYEPGSVQKVLTVAALLDAGKVTPRTRLVVPPVLPRSDRVIHDYFDHGRLRLTMTGVIAKSSNIGTVLAADEIGDRRLAHYLEAFGLGRPPGLGVAEAEAPGVLPDWRSWLPINKDTISFGQGVATSTVQMAAAVNTVANGGVYVQPSLVQGAATNALGETVGSEFADTRRVIGKKAAAQTTAMMEAVTDPEEGTAPSAAIPGYRVAGKTGTAQQVDEDCACYGNKLTVSFAGFAPADDPRFLVYVVVHDPESGGGGTVGGPAFNKIMTSLLTKYAVPPTGEVAPAPTVEW